MSKFIAWPKIPREQGETITITEKLDGTNACIIIEEGKIVGVQSRKRLITPEDDNYGFAGWVDRNKEELELLGDGYHYGEWCGLGIQKNPHNLDAKYFFLFNTDRWNEQNPNLPSICRVVPLLFEGDNDERAVELIMEQLKKDALAKEYVPEGIVVWYHRTRRYAKYTYTFTQGKWNG